MTSPEQQAIEELVSDLPKLKEKWEEHVREHDNTLPYVFLENDVARYAIRLAESGHHDVIRRLSEGLEKLAASKQPAIINLLQVGFLESFVQGYGRERRALEVLRKSFGPMMLKRTEEFENWTWRKD